MNNEYTKVLAQCVRIALGQDAAIDMITFDLDGDYEGFCNEFERLFGEKLWEFDY